MWDPLQGLRHLCEPFLQTQSILLISTLVGTFWEISIYPVSPSGCALPRAPPIPEHQVGLTIGQVIIPPISAQQLPWPGTAAISGGAPHARDQDPLQVGSTTIPEASPTLQHATAAALSPEAIPGASPAHQCTAAKAAALLQQESVCSPHRRHPLSTWFWWPSGIALLSPRKSSTQGHSLKNGRSI